MKKITAKVTEFDHSDNEVVVTIEDCSLEVRAAERDKFRVQTTLYLKAEEVDEAVKELRDAAWKLMKQQEAEEQKQTKEKEGKKDEKLN